MSSAQGKLIIGEASNKIKFWVEDEVESSGLSENVEHSWMKLEFEVHG
ncbi:hypothetical protein CCACVL1_04531 [Corchorus capsularis]|uniref:Uncharacterized protein n=1 Tax=Corchorus capsularis TaxID=210143 RepID=A0A1R3JRU3_COCAP|nr:hypothetical protein CCACVL1_04531 [Corchorus capsularis]